MNGKGKALALDERVVGCRLAQDVRDAAGRVLLAAGTELTAAVVASLRQRGVTGVHVEQALDAAAAAAQRQSTTRRLDHLFRAAGDDELLNRLHQEVLAYRLEKLP